MTDKRVINGTRLPDDKSLTANERAWIEMIRLVSCGTDPAPTLRAVQSLLHARLHHR